MKRLLSLLALSFGLASPIFASTVSSQVDSNTYGTGSYNNNPIDIGRFNGVSIQSVYSAASAASLSVSDGAKGLANLTIFNPPLKGDTIQIGSTKFTYGVDIATSTGDTAVIVATRTAAALNASSALNTTIQFSTGLAGANSVVTATTTLPGTLTPLLLASSTNTVWSAATFTGGIAPAVSVAADTLTQASHGLGTGEQVWISTTAGSPPTGLTYGTTYFVIRVDTNTFALATTSTTANAGTKIDITALAGGSTIGINPLSFAATSGQASNTGLKWQASNDKSNWSDLGISSITYSTAGNQQWDLGFANYQWIRMAVTGPSTGGLLITNNISGKN